MKERTSEVSAPSEAAVAETLQREGQLENTKTLGEKLLFGDSVNEKETKAPVISVASSSRKNFLSDIDSDGKEAEFEEADFEGPDNEEDSGEQMAKMMMKTRKSDSNDKDDDDDDDDDDEQSTEEQKKEQKKEDPRVRRKKKDAVEDGSHEAAVAKDRTESLPPLKRRHGKAAKDPTHRSRSPYRKEQPERREKTRNIDRSRGDSQI